MASFSYAHMLQLIDSHLSSCFHLNDAGACYLSDRSASRGGVIQGNKGWMQTGACWCCSSFFFSDHCETLSSTPISLHAPLSVSAGSMIDYGNVVGWRQMCICFLFEKHPRRRWFKQITQQSGSRILRISMVTSSWTSNLIMDCDQKQRGRRRMWKDNIHGQPGICPLCL